MCEQRATKNYPNNASSTQDNRKARVQLKRKQVNARASKSVHVDINAKKSQPQTKLARTPANK